MLTQTQSTEPSTQQSVNQSQPQSQPQAQTQQVNEQPQFDWRSVVDAELLKDPSLGTIKDINSLVKGYVHAQKLVGKNKIIIPDEFATEDDWKQIYHKLGLPETPDKYSINFGEAQYDEDFKKAYQEKAYQAGVLPKQAEELFNFWNEKINNATQEHQQALERARTEAIEGLRKEWGNGFEKKVETARLALKQFADDKIIDYLDRSGLGDDVNLIRLFAKIGESLNEDTFKSETIRSLGMTKEEAQSKINDIMGNFNHPYYNSEHPKHKEAVAEMQKYFSILES